MPQKAAQLEDRAKRSVVPLNGQSTWVPIRHPIYPALGKRILAGVLDLSTLIIILPAAWLASWPSTSDPDISIDYTAAWLAMLLVAGTLGWIYTVGMQCGENGATIGEQALGLRVSTISGRQLSFAAATKRYFGTVINLLCLGIPIVSCLANSRLQAWHEAATNTVVVDHRSTHSHIRAYAKRVTHWDAVALLSTIAAVFLWVQVFAWPWFAHYEDRDRVSRAISAVAPAAAELRSEFMRNAEFPTSEEIARDPKHQFPRVREMYAGQDAKAVYVGDGQIELTFNFEPLFHRTLLVKAVGQDAGNMYCVKHNLPSEVVPGWCEKETRPSAAGSYRHPVEQPSAQVMNDFEYGD